MNIPFWTVAVMLTVLLLTKSYDRFSGHYASDHCVYATWYQECNVRCNVVLQCAFDGFYTTDNFWAQTFVSTNARYLGCMCDVWMNSNHWSFSIQDCGIVPGRPSLQHNVGELRLKDRRAIGYACEFSWVEQTSCNEDWFTTASSTETAH